MVAINMISLRKFNWYKFLANTEVPMNQWQPIRWAYNTFDAFLWIIGILGALQVLYATYSYAPTFQIMQGLIFLILVVTVAVFLQMYNDKKLVPAGI